VKFYHGTSIRFLPGARIVPGQEPNFTASKQDRVYFTQDRAWALLYAIRVASLRSGKAAVYEVKPQALRTFMDVSQWGGVADARARWSRSPLVVVRQISVTPWMVGRAMDLISQMEDVEIRLQPLEQACTPPTPRARPTRPLPPLRPAAPPP
jgi:hypothetical protein